MINKIKLNTQTEKKQEKYIATYFSSMKVKWTLAND